MKPGANPLMRLLWTAMLVFPAFGAQAGVVFTSLYSFQASPDGADPQAALVHGGDGYFYGTTSGGGTNEGHGTVFRISTNGALTSLYSFRGGDGANPLAALVQGGDGYFYGTTYGGGANDSGTVFKITTNGALTSLYSFTATNDGANPSAGLVQGTDGYFYGTTKVGGTNGGHGTVFRIATNGALTSLHSFGGGNDGEAPEAALVQGNDGDFYGTTAYGGVFEIGTNGVLRALYSFTSADGWPSEAALVQGADGDFYGTTAYGLLFKISTNGAFTRLAIDTNANGGAPPGMWLAGDSDGYFYGTTGNAYRGSGTVFKMSSTGALTTLFVFNGNDGGYPGAAPVEGRDGYLYGTTEYGGANSTGTVFKISTNGVLTSLHSFGYNTGNSPQAGLAQGSDGYFYGTTRYGGTDNAGTIFRISAGGTYGSLYSFTGGVDGAQPSGWLVQGPDADFYGTAYFGGAHGAGTVFKISTDGAFTSLHSFTGGADGGDPYVGLVKGSDGNFYGTAGAVFRITPGGALMSLYSFTGRSNGTDPTAVVQGGDGNLYGTTDYGGTNANGSYGTVFKLSTNGTLTSLYSFNGTNDGGGPDGLVQGSDGNFYGTGYLVDAAYAGSVFKISPDGALETLHLFTGADGAGPEVGLMEGGDGNFYGTTLSGGASDSGVVFKISASGAFTTLYSFTGGNDGWNPNGELVRGSDGSFYGTTLGGGRNAVGTVFRLTVVSPAPPAFQAVTLTNGTLSLTWSTEAGGTYQLQYNSNLSSSNWVNVGGAVIATGATLSATDAVTNGPQRFYRVVLLP